MIIVNVQLQKMILSNYNRGAGDISVLYNDGKDRMVSKRVSVDNPDAVAGEFLQMLRKQIKEHHKPDYLEGDVFADTIIIRFNKEEEEAETKMKVFLGKINAKAKTMVANQQKNGMSYLNNWTNMRQMECEF